MPTVPPYIYKLIIYRLGLIDLSHQIIIAYAVSFEISSHLILLISIVLAHSTSAMPINICWSLMFDDFRALSYYYQYQFT